jgi:phosphotransferase system enzyme I (PtsI)
VKRLAGIGVSPGRVAGRAVILSQRSHTLRYYVPEMRVADELARLERSRARTCEQLIEIRALVSARRGPELGALFDAQLLMLDDAMLVPRAGEFVRGQQVNAEWALEQVFDELGAVFDDVADPYLRERKGDLADLVGRLRMNLRPGAATPRDLLREIDDGSVLVADELTPSLAAQVDWTRVRGFATDAGSRTHHTAILARSLDVPAIVGLHDASTLARPGQIVVIDADAGELILDPDADLLARVSQPATDDEPARCESAHATPAVTADGVRIRLEANIEFPDDLAAARYAGAEGIGLYRSEFLLASGASTSEDEQFDVYRRLLDGMAPAPVTVRTFDVDEDQLERHESEDGTDKGWSDPDERPGRQGLRGLRLSLARPDLFRTQLRALLRAARHGQLRIMFPFVSGVGQVREARRLLTEVAADLERGAVRVPRVPVGVMIEIPAAAFTADLLAREVDFFTIGTNDLIQYCLAVDRADDRVSRLYEPLHPAILRVIRTVGRAAARQGIPVSLCGEMASDPALLALLVGFGLRDFSMAPSAIGLATEVLAGIRTDDMRRLARRVIRLPSVADIEQELLATLGRLSLTGE